MCPNLEEEYHGKFSPYGFCQMRYIPSWLVRTKSGSEKLPKPTTVDPATCIEYSLYFPNPFSSTWTSVLLTITMEGLSSGLSRLLYLT